MGKIKNNKKKEIKAWFWKIPKEKLKNKCQTPSLKLVLSLVKDKKNDLTKLTVNEERY